MTTRRRDLTVAATGPTLFDLPLESGEDAGGGAPEPTPVPRPHAEPAHPDTLFDMEEPEPEPDREAAPYLAEPDFGAAPAAPTEAVVAGIVPRLLSGGADLLIHCGVLAATTLGLYAMAATPRPYQWPALLVLILAFSFFYTVVSLAFWGQTAGMAWCELRTHDRLERPLSFRQAALRWAGGILSLLLAGIPVLLALRGASLTDALSASVTVQQPLAD